MIIVIILTTILIYYLIKCYTSSECSKRDAMRIIAIQAARWSVAANQDNNPFIANLHANYGVGYVMSLRSIGTDKEIKRATGIDIQKLEKSATNAQRIAAQKLFIACPQIIPMEDPYLVQLSQSLI